MQDTITWYKIRHTGTQTAHWDIQNKEDLSLSDLRRFVLNVPVSSLRSSMADFVRCDQRIVNDDGKAKYSKRFQGFCLGMKQTLTSLSLAANV